MKRLTNEEVKVDESVDRYLGPLSVLEGMKPKLLDLVLNGPALNGVSKDVLRQIIRQLYSALAAYENTGLTPEQCETAKVIIESVFSDDTSKAERIRELLKADKERRLVVLPRKVGDTTSCETCKYRKDVFVPCDWLMQQEFVVIPPCPRYEKDE